MMNDYTDDDDDDGGDVDGCSRIFYHKKNFYKSRQFRFQIRLLVPCSLISIYTEQKWKRYTFAFGQHGLEVDFISVSFL